MRLERKVPFESLMGVSRPGRMFANLLLVRLVCNGWGYVHIYM